MADYIFVDCRSSSNDFEDQHFLHSVHKTLLHHFELCWSTQTLNNHRPGLILLLDHGFHALLQPLSSISATNSALKQLASNQHQISNPISSNESKLTAALKSCLSTSKSRKLRTIVISANNTELHRDFNSMPLHMKDAEICKFQMHLICLFGAEGETALGIEKITTSISPVQELHNNISIRYGFLSTAAAMLQQSFSKIRREASSQNCAGRIELTDTESVTVKITPCLLPSPEIEQVLICNCHGCKVLTTIDESGSAEIRCNSGNKKLKEKDMKHGYLLGDQFLGSASKTSKYVHEIFNFKLIAVVPLCNFDEMLLTGNSFLVQSSEDVNSLELEQLVEPEVNDSIFKAIKARLAENELGLILKSFHDINHVSSNGKRMDLLDHFYLLQISKDTKTCFVKAIAAREQLLDFSDLIDQKEGTDVFATAPLDIHALETKFSQVTNVTDLDDLGEMFAIEEKCIQMSTPTLNVNKITSNFHQAISNLMGSQQAAFEDKAIKQTTVPAGKSPAASPTAALSSTSRASSHAYSEPNQPRLNRKVTFGTTSSTPMRLQLQPIARSAEGATSAKPKKSTASTENVDEFEFC